MVLDPEKIIRITCRLSPDGFDPGITVIVATIATVAEVGTLAGAATCNVKLLVTVTLAEFSFEESATLVAVIVTAVGLGRICGAV